MTSVLTYIAILANAVYVGAAGYIALVEHPSRLACVNDIAWAQWVQSVKRTPRYAASALVAAAAGLLQGRLALGSLWTWGSVILLAIVPFTVMAMLPGQRRMTAPNWDPRSPETRTMLKRWGQQHAVRGLLGLAALILFLWSALFQN